MFNSLFVWGMGYGGINELLGIAIRPEWSWSWLRPRLIWGGIWGCFFLPLIYRADQKPIIAGVVIGLLPALNQLLYVFPFQLGHGILGLSLGNFTPLLVVMANLIWGIVAAEWIRWCMEAFL
ncbi:MAG: hypothetical protein ABEJ65_11530 [bacterium]